jgi:energy-coupling factor transporter transmembrane protein EcfT
MARLLVIFAYTIGVFFLKGPWLCLALAVNVVVMARCRIHPRDAARYISGALPFICFACVFNLALGYVEDALYAGARLVLICNITQCYKKTTGAAELAGAIERLFSPLAVFKIDPKDIGLMVCISLAFLPVLRRDFAAVHAALRAKGMRLSARTFKYVLKPFLIGIFQRTNEISRALRTKGYE